MVAIVAIVAVAATVITLGKGSGSGSTNAASPGGPAATGGGNNSTSSFASAGDTGPITIITNEPTCAAFNEIQGPVYNIEQNGWMQRDPSIPASDWTPEQRSQYQAVGAAISNAADQYVALAKQTPHRIVRELYEQSIAYGHAYADAIPHLTPSDDYLVRVYNGLGKVLMNICVSITYGSAAARVGLSGASPAPPQRTMPAGDPTQPKRFLTTADPFCTSWRPITMKLDPADSKLQEIDPNISATQWTPDQKSAYDAAGQAIADFTASAGKLAEQTTSSPTLTELMDLSVAYFGAYVKSIPTYTAADSPLPNVGMSTVATISSACGALGAWS